MARSELVALLPELAALLPNRSSPVTVQMHEGRVATISQDLPFCMLFDSHDKKTPVWRASQWTAASEARLSQFVHDKLTAPLREEIGLYGQLRLLFCKDWLEFQLEERGRVAPLS